MAVFGHNLGCGYACNRRDPVVYIGVADVTDPAAVAAGTCKVRGGADSHTALLETLL